MPRIGGSLRRKCDESKGHLKEEGIEEGTTVEEGMTEGAVIEGMTEEVTIGEMTEENTYLAIGDGTGTFSITNYNN